MALTDVNFQEGEGGDFMVVRTPGTQYAPTDIDVEESGAQYIILETPLITGGGGGGGGVYVLLD
jgi:hypothetical protein